MTHPWVDEHVTWLIAEVISTLSMNWRINKSRHASLLLHWRFSNGNLVLGHDAIVKPYARMRMWCHDELYFFLYSRLSVRIRVVGLCPISVKSDIQLNMMSELPILDWRRRSPTFGINVLPTSNIWHLNLWIQRCFGHEGNQCLRIWSCSCPCPWRCLFSCSCLF
jgi:hypothetical protein